ncbi:MAG: type II toxin-antitoxin system VapC family toxin [Bacteroidia bacterium]
MSYIIDTHILIWQEEGNSLLKPELRRLIEETPEDIFISHASIWEIVIKSSLGKLKMSIPVDQLEAHLIQRGYRLLNFSFGAYQQLLKLPFHHGDPFDRMLIAQAIDEDCIIISQDNIFSRYPVQLLSQ